MFTIRSLKQKSHFFDIEGRPSETFDASKKRLETVNGEEQNRRIEAMIGRSREVQNKGAQHQKSEQLLALGDLDREMTIMFTGAPPKDISKIAGGDRPGIRNMGPGISSKDIVLDDPSKKLSGKFADAKFSNTQGSIDIYTQGDRTILSTPGKDPVDFSTEVYASRKDLILSQYAQNAGVPESARAQTVQAPRSPKVGPVASPKVIAGVSGGEAGVALPGSETGKLSDTDTLDAARKDKVTALAALALVVNNPEARKPYEEMIQKADGEIQRLETKIAQAKTNEAYTRLSPEQREAAGMRTTLSDMRTEFSALLARDARGDKSVRTEMRSLFVDIKKLEGNVVSLERGESEINRLKGDIKTAQATLDARRGNDTYGTLTKQIESAKAGITRIEGEIVALRSSSAPVLAQYQNRSKNEKLV